MASFILTSLLAAGVALADVPANAAPLDLPVAPLATEVAQAYGGCASAVEQAVAMTGGEVLSVVPARNGRPVCKITVIVINAKGRPKRIRLRIPMD
jgi:hypothetical protein